jgi:CheY-like chemotaxis protein
MRLACPTTDDAGLEQPQVLLVDDDEVNLLLTALALRERGFQITEADSGEQALEMLASGRPTSSCSTP